MGKAKGKELPVAHHFDMYFDRETGDVVVELAGEKYLVDRDLVRIEANNIHMEIQKFDFILPKKKREESVRCLSLH